MRRLMTRRMALSTAPLPRGSPSPPICGVGETMTVLQEVVAVRADLAGRAPAAQLPQGRDHLVHPCSLEQPPRAGEPAGALRRAPAAQRDRVRAWRRGMIEVDQPQHRCRREPERGDEALAALPDPGRAVGDEEHRVSGGKVAKIDLAARGVDGALVQFNAPSWAVRAVMSSTTLPVCPKTGSTSPSLTVHLCLHTAPGNRECARRLLIVTPETVARWHRDRVPAILDEDVPTPAPRAPARPCRDPSPHSADGARRLGCTLDPRRAHEARCHPCRVEERLWLLRRSQLADRLRPITGRGVVLHRDAPFAVDLRVGHRVPAFVDGLPALAVVVHRERVLAIGEPDVADDAICDVLRPRIARLSSY